MPTDSNGVYSLVSTYFVELGETSDPSQHNPVFEDVGQGLTDRLMRDGRAPMTGNLNMDGNKVVGLADGVAATDAASKGQIDTVMSQAAPPGAVMAFARNTAPDGWLACRGQEVSRTTYSALFTAIGTTFGTGDGSTTFNLPNMRGYFPRGWNDTASGIDASRAFGSTQTSQNLQHNHTASSGTAGNHTHSGVSDERGLHDHGYIDTVIGSPGAGGTESGAGRGPEATFKATVANGNHIHNLIINAAGDHIHPITVNNSGGPEARPHNIALLYCIKT